MRAFFSFFLCHELFVDITAFLSCLLYSKFEEHVVQKFPDVIFFIFFFIFVIKCTALGKTALIS